MKRDPLAGLETFAQVARRIGRDPSRLRQLQIAGRLPQAVRVGRDWYLPAGAELPHAGVARKANVKPRSTA